MKTITQSEKSKRVIRSHRSVTLTDITFSEYVEGSGSFSYINNLFYLDWAIEYISGQERSISSKVRFYQIPYRERFTGVIPKSIRISTTHENDIIDDGNGNLIEEGIPDVVIGNIFYNSGVIVITNTTDEFNDSGLFIDIETATIYFKKRIELIEEKIFIFVDSTEITGTSNTTYDAALGSPFFLTKIKLYNDDNEVIAVASLSQPVPLSMDIFLILEFLDTI